MNAALWDRSVNTMVFHSPLQIYQELTHVWVPPELSVYLSNGSELGG